MSHPENKQQQDDYISVWSVPSRWRKYYLGVFGAATIIATAVLVYYDFSLYASSKGYVDTAVYSIRQLGSVVLFLAAISMIITEGIDTGMLFFEERRRKLEQEKQRHAEEVKNAYNEGVLAGRNQAEAEKLMDVMNQMFPDIDTPRDRRPD